MGFETEDHPRVIMYNKPAGEICTRRDEQDRPTVFSVLPSIYSGRWISIGRLDVNTCGLLLFTNSGQLAHRLMHPSHDIEREYAVRVIGDVSDQVLQRLTQGVSLEDGRARFEKIIDGGGQGANHWYHVVITVGRNRLVRRLWESQNITVSRLIRVRFGSLILPKTLPQGRWAELPAKIIKQL